MPYCISAAAVAYTAREAWQHEFFEECAAHLNLLGYGRPGWRPREKSEDMYEMARYIEMLTDRYEEEWNRLHDVGLLASPFACSFPWDDPHSTSLASPTTGYHRKVLDAGVIVCPPSRVKIERKREECGAR